MNLRAYYSSSIHDFLTMDAENILGSILIYNEFETTDLQKNSWREEIHILQQELKSYGRGEVIFEYTIPRMGHRVDVVCLINGIIFLLEFKVGDKQYTKSAADQVMDYALDLKYFHEKSKGRYIIPIVVSTEAATRENQVNFMRDNISGIIYCNKANIGENISRILQKIVSEPFACGEWVSARYSPTPTIIEAAQALYREHDVKSISRNDAGAQNLTATTLAISKIIEDCKKRKKKAICFVTGVPGAGKTLAGLNIANERHQFDENEHAVFLSGNGPLVDVLQNALANDKKEREGITKERALREAKAFIQIVHKFRDDALQTDEAPVEKVAIFDEAQRAWNEETLAKFMKRKRGLTDFRQSEPEFLISVMDRHQDWSVIVCLVGGGQEIHTGEAGINEWIEAIKKIYSDWDVFISDKIINYEYTGNLTLGQLFGDKPYQVIPELHLGTSLRSFRSENVSVFVQAMLDEEINIARKVYKELSAHYPLVMTRNLDIAKKWVRRQARGTERYGLLVSSGGKRLRADGIWSQSEIDPVKWFLNKKDHVDSSYYLEVAASEFDVQGLEVDYSILAWDADFRYTDSGFNYFNFRGTKWTHVRQDIQQKYLKNAYRVLLTRARQGMVIYIPEGSKEDTTRLPMYYDLLHDYLQRIGIEEIYE